MKRFFFFLVIFAAGWLQGWLFRNEPQAAEAGGEPPAACATQNGDCNGDCQVNISDASCFLNWLFLGGDAPVPICSAHLPDTEQADCFDAAGQRIACDNQDFPGQDGFYQGACGAQGRFIDNRDGTVTDTITGLMWLKASADVDRSGAFDSNDTQTWQGALQFCEALPNGLQGGLYSDWRLPNVRELQSIVNYDFFSPAIDVEHFDATALSTYWTSTTSNQPGTRGAAYVVSFTDGTISLPDKSGTAYVRAVRNAP
jgi:hypothetical protein